MTDLHKFSQAVYESILTRNAMIDNVNCRELAENLQRTCRELAENLQRTCRELAENLQRTCRELSARWGF